MEIQAWLFISFWAIMSITFLHLGFHALDKTELSHSVSPLVMFLFKHSLAVSSCFSSSYALKSRAQPRYAVRSNYVLLVYLFFSFISPQFMKEVLYILLVAPWAWVPYIPYFNFVCICLSILSLIQCLGMLCLAAYKLIVACKNNFSELKTRTGIVLALEIFFLLASAENTNFFPILVLFLSHLISVSCAALPRFGDYTIVPNARFSDGLIYIAVRYVSMKMEEVVTMLKEHKVKKFIEFAVGMVGAILFQNFFRITSFSEVAAFLYFAVAWLANLVLLGFCGDFGVFNFLLANVVVGCTVGQFGVHGATWLALGAALLLFALRLKLESVTMAYEQAQRIQISFFGGESGTAENLGLNLIDVRD